MKNRLFYFINFALLIAFVGCHNELDTTPDGDIVNDEQLSEIYEMTPDRIQASVTGFSSYMVAFPAVSGDRGEQDDFGYPAIVCMMEHNGQDVAADPTGYNWFSGDVTYSDRLYSSVSSARIWRYFYKHIKRANDVLKFVDPETEVEQEKFWIGQSLVIRAFNYLHLAQLYQYTYNTNPEAPSVPLVTELSTTEELANNPRAKLSEVYDFILEDLTKAIELLDGFSRSNVSAVDLAVAYGIRARANLVLQNWNNNPKGTEYGNAYADASKALEISGAQPYTLAEVSEPNFDEADHASVLWGGIITDKDDASKSGICNWTSMFTSLCFGYGGYTTMVDCWKKININLYEKISSTDVRKGWWIDENLTSSTVGVSYKGLKFANAGMHPYTNIKFAPVDKNPFSPSNSVDFTYMRSEEMILIKAEAAAMGGDLSLGKSILTDFLTNYRDPGYEATATSIDDFQDEIWIQRRIELWGEGFSWFDIMRLKKPILRKENGKTNFSTGAIFNIDKESPIMLWAIPRSELLSNKGISESDNNNPGTPPDSE